MGKGIALEFRKRFGRMDELIKQHKEVGEVATLDITPVATANTTATTVQTDDEKEKNKKKKRCIFYMVTKEKFYQKPTYASLEKCLVALNSLCFKLGICSLSMPRIGCGLDRLQWDDVHSLLKRTMTSLTNIDVYEIKQQPAIIRPKQTMTTTTTKKTAHPENREEPETKKRKQTNNI